MSDMVEKLIKLAGELPNDPEVIWELRRQLSAAHDYKENRNFISMVCAAEAGLQNILQEKRTVTIEQAKSLQEFFGLGLNVTYEQFEIHEKLMTKHGWRFLPYVSLMLDEDFEDDGSQDDELVV